MPTSSIATYARPRLTAGRNFLRTLVRLGMPFRMVPHHNRVKTVRLRVKEKRKAEVESDSGACLQCLLMVVLPGGCAFVASISAIFTQVCGTSFGCDVIRCYETKPLTILYWGDGDLVANFGVYLNGSRRL